MDNIIVTVGDLLTLKKLMERSLAGDEVAQCILNRIKRIVYGD